MRAKNEPRHRTESRFVISYSEVAVSAKTITDSAMRLSQRCKGDFHVLRSPHVLEWIETLLVMHREQLYPSTLTFSMLIRVTLIWHRRRQGDRGSQALRITPSRGPITVMAL